MTIDQVIKYFGSELLAADGLKKSHQTILNWKKKGYVPYWSQLAIQTITNGKLKANKK